MPFVYVLSNPSYPEGTYKIGHTTKSIEQRLASLNNTSVPTPFKIEAQYEIEDSYSIEQAVFAILSNYRLSANREFFSNGLTLAMIHNTVISLIDEEELGINTLTPYDIAKSFEEKEKLALFDEWKEEQEIKHQVNIDDFKAKTLNELDYLISESEKWVTSIKYRNDLMQDLDKRDLKELMGRNFDKGYKIHNLYIKSDSYIIGISPELTAEDIKQRVLYDIDGDYRRHDYIQEHIKQLKEKEKIAIARAKQKAEYNKGVTFERCILAIALLVFIVSTIQLVNSPDKEKTSAYKRNSYTQQ